MTLTQALKDGLIIEIESDFYLTVTGRELKYDRYYYKKRSRRPSNMWIDGDGNVFYNFHDAYYCTNAYIWA